MSYVGINGIILVGLCSTHGLSVKCPRCKTASFKGTLTPRTGLESTTSLMRFSVLTTALYRNVYTVFPLVCILLVASEDTAAPNSFGGHI